MRRHRKAREMGVLTVALMMVPLTAAATIEQPAPPASAGYGWSTQDPLVYVTAIIEVPTLDCRSAAELLSFPAVTLAALAVPGGHSKPDPPLSLRVSGAT